MQNNGHIPRLLPETPVEERKEIFRSPYRSDLKYQLLAQARIQQRRVLESQARLNRFNVDGRNKTTTFGEVVGRISMPVYFQMRQLYGDECWNDPDFVKAFFRDNPGAKVKHNFYSNGQEIVRGK